MIDLLNSTGSCTLLHLYASSQMVGCRYGIPVAVAFHKDVHCIARDAAPTATTRQHLNSLVGALATRLPVEPGLVRYHSHPRLVDIQTLVNQVVYMGLRAVVDVDGLITNTNWVQGVAHA